VYVVRWLRPDGREYRQRYYRRLPDALAFSDHLHRHGLNADLWVTRIDVWTGLTTGWGF